MTLFGRKVALTMIQGAKDASDAPDGPDVDSFVTGGATRATAVVASDPAVSLESVLSSDITLAWDEAVSIVEGLCEVVQGSVVRTIPGATEIFITGAGAVAVRSGAGTPAPVEAGRRLLELLGKTTVPAPLRLFASQAVRAEQHSSIVEFHQGLKYFAKPGGRERIAAVYERYSRELAAMPFASEAETRPAKALDKAPDKAKTGDKGAARWKLGREAVLAGAAIVVTVAVVSGGYLAWQELAKPSADAEPVEQVQAEAAAATRRPAGRRPETRTTTAAAGTPASGRPGAAAPGAATGRATTPRPDGVDLEVIGRPPVPAPLSESAAAGSAPVAGEASPPVSTAPLFVQGTPSEPLDLDRLYSTADAGLVPATLVREQLLPPAMGVPEGMAPLRIELIVSAEGAVERARFMVPPRRMADMMLLSSAKMWTFNPALKDGRPVRSRVVLSWFVAP